MLSWSDTDLVAQEIERILRGTPFQGRWNINGQPSPDTVNLYLISGSMARASVDPLIREVVGVMAFVGDPGIVVIDVDELDSFFELHQFTPFEGFGSERTVSMRLALWRWILSHEVGHVVLGHGIACFVNGSWADVVESATMAHAQEYEADQFAAEVYGSGEETGRPLGSYLISLLNYEIQRELDPPDLHGVGVHFDYNSPEILRFAASDTHPSFVLRAVRLLTLLDGRPGNEENAVLLGEFVERLGG